MMLDLVSDHFGWHEVIRCGAHGGQPDGYASWTDYNAAMLTPTYRDCAARMAWLMESVRRLLGGQPVNVHSWFRCELYNERIGGARRSQHMTASAVDFHVSGQSVTDTHAALVRSLPREGFGQLILEAYQGEAPGWVHLSLANPARGLVGDVRTIPNATRPRV